MSKNMTRKGLAFGAGFALVASGLAAAPAQADGLTGFITLKPNSGPANAFTVIAGANYDFQVVAQPASTVGSAGTLRFLVTDPSLKVTPKLNSLEDDGVGHGTVDFPSIAMDTSDTLTFESDGDLVIGGLANSGLKIKGGDFISFNEDLDSNADTEIVALDTLIEVKTATTSSITIDAADVTRPTLDLKTGSGADKVASTTNGGNVDLTSIDGDASVFEAGDTVTLSGDLTSDVGGTTTKHLDAGTFAVDDATADTLSFDGDAIADIADNDVDSDITISLATSTSLGTNKIFKVYRPTAVSGQYVVDSGISNGSAVGFAVTTSDAETRTATIQAWVDNFDNEVIDPTEYVSDEVTVTFLKSSSLKATTTLTNPNVGDETLEATIVTDPVLNGDQLTAADVVGAVFTRAGYATKLLSDTRATQNVTTGEWTTTIDVAPQGTPGDTLSSYTLDGTETTGNFGAAGDVPDKEVVGGNDTDKTDGSQAANEINEVDIAATGVVTVTTDAGHNLSDGDIITFTQANETDLSQINAANTGKERPVTVTGEKTFTFTLDTTADVTAKNVENNIDAGTKYNVVTYTTGDTANQYYLDSRVIPGDYSATAFFSANGDDGVGTAKFNPISPAAAKGTLAVTAADVIFTTTGSESVQAIRENDATNDDDVDLLLKEGTTSATVLVTVVDKDGDPVGSGRSVSVTPSAATAGSGIEVAGKASGKTASLTTDANGQVEVEIESTDAADGDVVDITVVAEGKSSTTSILEVKWEKAALQLIDLNTTAESLDKSGNDDGDETRTVSEGASYDVALLVADQWYTVADSDDFRLKVSGSGVTEGFQTLTDGRTTVTITDTEVSSDFNTVLTLQKKGTTGVFADTTISETISTKTDDNPGILLGADGSTLYGSQAADLSDTVALKALVERDTRTSFIAQPAYTNSVVVTGKVVDDGTKVGLGGAVVTVSGPDNILFANGSVESRGSITFLADESDGDFDVTLYSTSAQEDTEITVTALGVSETVDVTFTGQTAGEGTVLSINAPDNVSPASSFQVTASLQDELGNGVSTGSDGTIKITRTGPGITFGTLPTDTDANGEASFSVLLGANDTGTIVVTVSYDQNDDGDFKDAKDLTVTKTITVGDAPVTQKVNAGSFKGFVAVYARGYEDQRLSAKIGNDWVIVDPIVNNQENGTLFRVTDFTGAGVDIQVRIYIDRVLVDTIPLTTK